MSSFVLSAAAEEDLIQIYTHGVVAFGPDQARQYHRIMSQVFEFLADNPLAAPVRPELRTDVRVYPTGSHIVLYTARTRDILILRVRHQHEDWLDH